MNNSDLGKIVKSILASWPTQRQRMSDEDAAGFTLACKTGLADLEYGQARAAVDRLVKTSKFLPSVAEVREAAVVDRQGERKSGGAAWGEVTAMVKRYGGHRAPGIDFEVADPLVAEVIRALGWRDLCDSRNQAADRARFIELYDQLARQARKAAQLAPGVRPPVLAAPLRTNALSAQAESVFERVLSEIETSNRSGTDE